MKRILSLTFILFFIGLPTCFCDVNRLITDAINGDAKAQFELGEHYEKKKYTSLMFQWYEKASEQGNILAQERLAQKYFNNGYVDKAFNLAKKLSELDNKIGKSILAYYYCWGGYEVPVDKNLSLKLINESMDIPLSKAVLANFYLNGFWNVKKDSYKALKLAKESFDEGCMEGGCIYNRICTYSNFDNNIKDKIYEKYKESDYIDAVLNYNWNIAFHGEKNIKLAYNNIESYKGNSSGYLYYFLTLLEIKNNNKNKVDEYLNKSASLWHDESIFSLINDYIKKAGYRKKDYSKVKELVSLALKTKQPNLIAKLYYLFNEANEYKKIPNEALPDNVDWNKVVKEGADNGHPVLMIIHAYNIGKDDKEYNKYMKQAYIMGAKRFIPDCINYCEDKNKWRKINTALEEEIYRHTKETNENENIVSENYPFLNEFEFIDKNN